MKIDSVSSINKTTLSDSSQLTDEPTKAKNNNDVKDTSVDVETQQAIDQATGLLQTIVSTKASDKVLRKMPSDEYLHLLSLLDEIISGSIDKHV